MAVASVSSRTAPMKDMTLDQAKAEALKRWGPASQIAFRPPRASKNGPGRLARYSYTVSNGATGSYRAIEGQGNSWREAFDDARPR